MTQLTCGSGRQGTQRYLPQYQREQNKSAELGNHLDNLCLYFLNGFKSVKSYEGYAFCKVANKEKQEKQYKLECVKIRKIRTVSLATAVSCRIPP